MHLHRSLGLRESFSAPPQSYELNMRNRDQANRLIAAEDDFVFVERVLAGDRRAVEPLVRRHERRVFRVTLAILGNIEDAEESTLENLRTARTQSGSHALKQPIEGQAQPAQKQQRGEIVRDDRRDLHREVPRHAVAGCKVMNHRCQQHVEKTAAHMGPPVGTAPAGQPHLGDRFAAKRALCQADGDGLTAKDALARFLELIHRSGHTNPSRLLF